MRHALLTEQWFPAIGGSIQLFDAIYGQHMPAGLGEAGEALAGAHEQLDTQLVFQLTDLAAHPGLRGVQHVGDLREVEAAAYGLPHRA